MNINLKELAEQRLAIEYLLQNKEDFGKAVRAKPIKKLLRFLEEVEVDLEMAGESITELDSPRLEAIEERNKWLAFIKSNDDV
jgi:hypothetical protein